MTKKSFLSIAMVFLGLFAGTNTAWAQLPIDLDPNAMQDPTNWFYVNLEAKVSTPSCGRDPGNVKLLFTDMTNDPTPQNPRITGPKPVNPCDRENDYNNYDRWNVGFKKGENDAKNGNAKEYESYWNDSEESMAIWEKAMEGYDAAWAWYEAGEDLNPSNPTGWSPVASLRGYSVVHAAGIEVQNFISTYAYFRGEAQENPGWYFAGWSYTEGDYDLGGAIGETMLFKIFPDEKPGLENITTQHVYATFKPVMVANYTVNGTIDVAPGNGNSASNTIVFDVQGERLDASDFKITVDGEYGAHGTCVPVITSVDGGKVVVTVTYTASDDATGSYRCKVTLASESDCSQLTAPIFARVANVSSEEASLYSNKIEGDPSRSGNLTAMIAAAASVENPIVVLNKDYSAALSIGSSLTLDLNGHSLNNTLAVTAGEVTLAYSKFGGKITRKVTISNGATLTLDGGTIEVNGETNVVAVEVQKGGSLIQNGATILASGPSNVIALNVAGTAAVKDGIISAHADHIAAFAAQVTGNGKLTTTGGAFDVSVDHSLGGTFSVADQSTWSNAYAVYVAAATGEAQIQGGTFNATSDYVNSFGVCPLATMGKMTVGRNVVATAHTGNSQTVAYAVRAMGSADLTINGGYFKATHMENGVTVNHAPVLAAQYTQFTFNSGYIQTDNVFVRDESLFPQSLATPEPVLYNITYKGQDYQAGYRYLAVRDGYDTKTAGVQTARIGTTGYTSIADALAFANNNRDKEVVIVLQNNDVLPAGYYTLPSKATLIIPMKYEQETGYTTIPRVVSTNKIHIDYVQPTPYVTLTMADGVNMNVYGTIEVSGTQRSSDESYASLPHGPCGYVRMEEGSRMTMLAGAELRAWGFIIGKGETDVRRDATVREQFQMGDWKGGSTSFGMLSRSERVFPLTHYFIQNIESPFKYHPGAILSTTTSVSATLGSIPLTASANDIKIVGVSGRDEAMFLMDNEADADNTWVRKWYDVENDLQVYEVSNSAHIGSMVLDLGKLGTMPLQMNSGYFVLPITCNMKIHLLSGMMDFTQNTALLPGAEVEIDKESTVTILKNPNASVLSGSLYVYSAQQWDKYAYDDDSNGGSKYTKPVKFAAGFEGQPTARAEQFNDLSKLKDATINVHGSFALNYDETYLLTSGGGANIYSTNEDAGTYIFGVNGPAADYSEQVYQVKNRSTYTDADFTPAQLRNKEGEDPVFTQTAEAFAGTSFCFMENQWRNRFYFDCYAADVDLEVYEQELTKKMAAIISGGEDNSNIGNTISHIYIKPCEWVEITGTAVLDVVLNYDQDVLNSLATNEEKFGYLASTMEEMPVLTAVNGNADHTYSDAAGEGKLYILMDQDCQWWEVEKKDNLYHCIHPNNDTYYYWDDNREVDDELRPGWVEKKFTITWKDWDGTIIQTTDKEGNLVDNYDVTYGTMAEYLGTNPTRPETVDYTYDFTGWTPKLGPVKSDVTYTATYAQQPRKYTIIFCNEGGTEIERHFLTHNEIPVCGKTPTKPGHTLEWTPAIAAVTGDATYTAKWLEEPPTEYQITFVDYDGDLENHLLWQGNVAVGTMPAAPDILDGKPVGSIEGKPSTSEFTYVFDHWAPTVTKVTQAMTYTAVYREVAKTYTIIFQNEDGTEIESHQYAYGETPVCFATPTKAATEQCSYIFAWTPQIETVRGAATYKAVFTPVTNKYTVSVKCTPSGAAVLTGGGIYEYGSSITISKTDNPGYDFVNWTDANGAIVNTLPTTITGDINLVANYTVTNPDYTITWKNWDGTILQTVGQKSGTATTYTGAAPEKEPTAAFTYVFDGWATQKNGPKVYKNGMTPKATADATYYAHFAEEPIPNLEIASGLTNLTAPVEYQNLILTSNGFTSGQLLGADEHLSLTGHAYFDFAINAKARKWYAVSVPWQVDPLTGISANGHTLSLGRNFDIVYYDGAERAANGTNKAWRYVEDDADKTLIPGRTYMIALTSDAPVIRFMKIDSAPFMTPTTSVEEHSSEVPTDANWNGVGNPALFHAFVNTGTEFGQVYNSDKDSYSPIVLSSEKLIVGQGVYVQAPNAATVSVEYGAAYAASSPSLAPRRVKEEVDDIQIHYEVRIAPINQDMTDRLFARMNTNKTEDVYTLGEDLVKMGVSSSVAQMWINRYDTKLCLNTMAPIEGSAEYPLGIAVPVSGEYTISIMHSPADNAQAEALYLTLNGEAIWDLSKNAYTTEFEQGTTTIYGLRIRAKAPQTTTPIDEIMVDSQGAAATKVLIDNQVYIIRGNKIYTIQGQIIK